MAVFAIVCLMVIIVGLTHCLNWVCRLAYNDKFPFMGAVFCSLLYFVIVYACVVWIITWGRSVLP